VLIDNGVSLNSTFNVIQFRLTSGGLDTDMCAYETGTVAGTAGTTTITGTSTAWTSAMTAANGWKIWINSGVHKNMLYDFTRTAAGTATVTELLGTTPANDFTGAPYVIYRQGYAACAKGWELLKVNLDATLLMSGHTEVER
jgi:hypothetical protein